MIQPDQHTTRSPMTREQMLALVCSTITYQLGHKLISDAAAELTLEKMAGVMGIEATSCDHDGLLAQTQHWETDYRQLSGTIN